MDLKLFLLALGSCLAARRPLPSHWRFEQAAAAWRQKPTRTRGPR